MYKKNIVPFHFVQHFEIDYYLYTDMGDSIVYNRKEK